MEGRKLIGPKLEIKFPFTESITLVQANVTKYQYDKFLDEVIFFIREDFDFHA